MTRLQPQEKVEYPQSEPYELLKKGYIVYSRQVEEAEKSTTYVKAISGDQDVKKTLIEFKMYSVEGLAHDIYNRLLVFDQEANTDYSEKFSEELISKIVRKSLLSIKDKTGKVSEANRNQTLAAFGVIKRKGTKSLRFKIEAKDLIKKSTREIDKNSFGIGSLRRDSTVKLKINMTLRLHLMWA